MKHKPQPLIKSLCSTINLIRVDLNNHCLQIRYWNDDKLKTAVFPKGKKLYKLLVYFDKIHGFEDGVLYRNDYETTMGDNGVPIMNTLKDLVHFEDIEFTPDEAKELCVIYEYSEALEKSGTIITRMGKVINMAASHFKKGIA